MYQKWNKKFSSLTVVENQINSSPTNAQFPESGVIASLQGIDTDTSKCQVLDVGVTALSKKNCVNLMNATCQQFEGKLRAKLLQK